MIVAFYKTPKQQTITMATTYKQNNKYSTTFMKLPIEIEVTQATQANIKSKDPTSTLSSISIISVTESRLIKQLISKQSISHFTTSTPIYRIFH